MIRINVIGFGATTADLDSKGCSDAIYEWYSRIIRILMVTGCRRSGHQRILSLHFDGLDVEFSSRTERFEIDTDYEFDLNDEVEVGNVFTFISDSDGGDL